MKEITSTVYKAFDGKEFTDSKECGQYEFEITKDLTLKTFDVNIPLKDDFCTYTAYLINNEMEFNMMFTHYYYKSDNSYGIEEYEGAGWYLVQLSDNVWVEIFKLSDIIAKYTGMLADIAKKTMEFGNETQMINTAKYSDFCDDAEKMRDFAILTKDEFLMSYSYLTEEEYDLTARKVGKK